ATWVVANAEGHGFFRVRYVGALQEALAERVLEVCSKVERYQLVDDTWASVLAGSTPAEAFLALAERMADETDVSVWRRLLGGLDQLDRLVDGDARDALRARIRAVVAPALERMGWEPGEGESDRERELRGALIGALAVLADDADAQARVRALFTRVRQGEAVEANVAAAVVRATAALATDRELDELIAGFREGKTPQEEQRYLYALADVREPGHMDRVLELAMTPEVRTQNAPFLIGACLANRDHGAKAWDLVERRWDEMNERFPSNSIVRMLHGIRPVGDPDLAARIEAFLADHPVPQAKQTLQQHLERMRVSVALRAREAARFAEHLRR